MGSTVGDTVGGTLENAVGTAVESPSSLYSVTGPAVGGFVTVFPQSSLVSALFKPTFSANYIGSSYLHH